MLDLYRNKRRKRERRERKRGKKKGKGEEKGKEGGKKRERERERHNHKLCIVPLSRIVSFECLPIGKITDTHMLINYR